MKNYIGLFWIVAIALFNVSIIANGDAGHSHEAAVEPAPLGGMLRDAPPFKSEIILEKDLVKLYVYDQKLKVIKLDKDTLQGDVQFPKEKKVRPITFKRTKEKEPKKIPSGDLVTERYETRIPNINKVHRFDMHVWVAAGDKKAKADFGIDNIN